MIRARRVERDQQDVRAARRTRWPQRHCPHREKSENEQHSCEDDALPRGSDGTRRTGGASRFIVQDRLPVPVASTAPGSLVATLLGSVVRVLGKVGDRVREGDLMIVIEAMKMEHIVVAPADGVIEAVRYAPGDLVEEGAELIALAPESEEPH